MTRIDEDALALHFEVALAAVAPELLDGLGDADRYRRRAAYADTARHLAERMRCFDVQSVDAKLGQAQPSLFPDDLGPISACS